MRQAGERRGSGGPQVPAALNLALRSFLQGKVATFDFKKKRILL